MQTQTIHVPPKQARALWRDYKKHRHYDAPLDAEIGMIYQRLAQGRTVIRALASIVAAGVHASGPYAGLPVLAIAPADAEKIYWRPDWSTHRFQTSAWARSNAARRHRVDIPRAWWPAFNGQSPRGEALLPRIPATIAPRRGLANYHILWEAEWTRVPPGDPLLLRRIGQADAWLVVGAWELTAVEKAALAMRMHG